MQFTYEIEINAERITGKFVSRDEIQEAIQTALDEAVGYIDLSGMGDTGESEYEVTDSAVNEQAPVGRTNPAHKVLRLNKAETKYLRMATQNDPRSGNKLKASSLSIRQSILEKLGQ